MSELIKIKVDFENEGTKAILDFVTETQDGKYSEDKIDLTLLKYSRFEIQDEDIMHSLNEHNREDVLFFGITS